MLFEIVAYLLTIFIAPALIGSLLPVQIVSSAHFLWKRRGIGRAGFVVSILGGTIVGCLAAWLHLETGSRELHSAFSTSTKPWFSPMWTAQRNDQ